MFYSATHAGQSLFLGGFPSYIRSDGENLTENQMESQGRLFSIINSVGLIGCVGDLMINSREVHLPFYATQESEVKSSCPRKQKVCWSKFKQFSRFCTKFSYDQSKTKDKDVFHKVFKG